jgi:hypothetical protein
MYKLPCQNSVLFQFSSEPVASCRLVFRMNECNFDGVKRPISKMKISRCKENVRNYSVESEHQKVAKFSQRNPERNPKHVV